MNNKNDRPSPDEKICYNCKHLLWMVGIGQGIKCDLNKKSLPSRWYTCDNFENRWVVNKVKMDKSTDICAIHNTLLDEDGQCKKCLEQNNK